MRSSTTKLHTLVYMEAKSSNLAAMETFNFVSFINDLFQRVDGNVSAKRWKLFRISLLITTAREKKVIG